MCGANRECGKAGNRPGLGMRRWNGVLGGFVPAGAERQSLIIMERKGGRFGGRGRKNFRQEGRAIDDCAGWSWLIFFTESSTAARRTILSRKTCSFAFQGRFRVIIVHGTSENVQWEIPQWEGIGGDSPLMVGGGGGGMIEFEGGKVRALEDKSSLECKESPRGCVPCASSIRFD